MTRSHAETRGRNAGTSTWWTPRRTNIASICGFVGGLGGLGVLGPLTGSAGSGAGLGSVSLLYPLWHVLLAVALLAATAKYGPRYGRGGRLVAIFLALSLMSYASLTLVFVAIRTVPTDLFLLGILTGTVYMAIRLFGSLYGILLWQRDGIRTRTDGLTAALLIVSFPSLFVLGPLTQIGFPAELIGVPFYTAFIVLSYGFWAGEAETVETKRGGTSHE